MEGSTLLLTAHVQRVVQEAARSMQDIDVARIIELSMKKDDGFEYVRHRRPDGDIYRKLLMRSAGEEREKYISTRRNRDVKDNVELHRVADGDIRRLMDARSGATIEPYAFTYSGYGHREMSRRQKDLDLCLSIDPALNSDEINMVLWKFFGESPLHVRNPIDAIYTFIFQARDEGSLPSLSEQRACARELLAYADEELRWGVGMDAEGDAIPPTLSISQELFALAGESVETFKKWLARWIVFMDVRDRRYSVRKRLMSNLSVVAEQIGTSDKAASNRLEVMESLTGDIGNDLHNWWQEAAHQFIGDCGGELPEEFPDRDQWKDYADSIMRGDRSVRADEPDFLQALRSYAAGLPEDHLLRRRIEAIRASQKNLETLLGSKSILQYIVSDHHYACLTDKGKRKKASEADSADNVSNRIRRLTSSPHKIVSPSRSEAFDVPRSLFILSELARMRGESGRHAGLIGLIDEINTQLCAYGFPMLDVRIRLDYLIFCALYTAEHNQEDPDFYFDMILEGLHEIIEKLVFRPCNRLSKELRNRATRTDERASDRQHEPAGR